MRTTVTLDGDVEHLLREAMHANRKSFKETLNDVLRAGLLAARPGPAPEPFLVESRPMGLRGGLDPASFNKLVDEMDEEEFLKVSRGDRKP